MTYLNAITVFHTAICFAALAAGAIAVAAVLQGRSYGNCAFLILATASSVTGYFFPFHGVTPAMIVGAVALLVLAVVLLARYRFRLLGAWRRIYAGGMVASLYFLAFVGVVQAFQKVPALSRIAPTQSEPPFAVTQIVVLCLFLIIGWQAAVRFQPPATARPVANPGIGAMNGFDRRAILAGGASTLLAAKAWARSERTDMSDLLIVNAKVTTLDRENPQAQALAIRDGRFLAVGTEQEARAAAAPDATVIDARGGGVG